MTIIINEDWLSVLENTDYIPIENENNTYQSYRFVDLDLESVTIENYIEKLMPSLKVFFRRSRALNSFFFSFWAESF